MINMKKEVAKRISSCTNATLCICIDFWFDFLIKNAGMKIHEEDDNYEDNGNDGDDNRNVIMMKVIKL